MWGSVGGGQTSARWWVGVVGVEQGDALDVLAGEVGACPVGRVDAGHAPRVVGPAQADEGGFLVADLVDAGAGAIEDDDHGGEVEVFQVGDLLEQEEGQVLPVGPGADVGVGGGQVGDGVLEGEACAVAGEGVEELVLAEHFVFGHSGDELVGEAVVRAVGDVVFAFASGDGAWARGLDLGGKDLCGVGHGGGGGFEGDEVGGRGCGGAVAVHGAELEVDEDVVDFEEAALAKLADLARGLEAHADVAASGVAADAQGAGVEEDFAGGEFPQAQSVGVVVGEQAQGVSAMEEAGIEGGHGS